MADMPGFTQGPPMPGTPWFRLQPVPYPAVVGTPAVPVDMTVSQTVTFQSRFSVNAGQLSSGRRRDRPGG